LTCCLLGVYYYKRCLIEREGIDYKDTHFDLHIDFSEDINQYESIEEWKQTCSVEICGLMQRDDSDYLEVEDYGNSLVVPITFEFDPMTLQ